MPNGRCGGFVIGRANLKQIVTAVPETAILGKLAIVGKLINGLRLRAVSAAEIDRLVDECPDDRVAVEEQDHTFYIIHLHIKPDHIRVSVTSESPIFAELRRRHTEWMVEQPGWDGWKAF